jgi:PAS domain-containing protein
MTTTLPTRSRPNETTSGNRLDRLPPVEGEVNVTALRSLLLGLRLRGHICDEERLLLDELAPDSWITFLASTHGWVHPNETRLFDLDKLQATTHQGGGAIFSQQCRAEHDRHRCWRVLSAVIADDHQAPLILGWCGPESEAVADRLLPAYSNLVRQARSAWSELDDLVDELSCRLARSEPMLVVNRSSGRIIAANEAAAYAFDSTRRELIGKEFSSLPRSVQRGWTSGRMSMRNLDAAGLNLSVVTMDTPVVAADNETFVADFFTYRVRHKISHILMATTLLESLAAENENRPESSLVGNIVGEVELLNEYINKANILIDYDRLSPDRIGLATALDESIGLVEQALVCDGSVKVLDDVGNPEFRAPHRAVVALFEAVLLSHLIDRPIKSRTLVSITSPPESVGVTIRFETQTSQTDGRLAADRGWLDYADRLASKLGIGTVHSHNQTDRLSTCLTITPENQTGRNQ